MPENIASVRVLEKPELHHVDTITFWGTGSQNVSSIHKTAGTHF
jgi:hypothetical protein